MRSSICLLDTQEFFDCGFHFGLIAYGCMANRCCTNLCNSCRFSNIGNGCKLINQFKFRILADITFDSCHDAAGKLKWTCSGSNNGWCCIMGLSHVLLVYRSSYCSMGIDDITCFGIQIMDDLCCLLFCCIITIEIFEILTHGRCDTINTGF